MSGGLTWDRHLTFTKLNGSMQCYSDLTSLIPSKM